LPDPLKASIYVVVPPLVSLSQLFVHLLVLSVEFVPSMPCIGVFEFCMSHGTVYEFEVLFATGTNIRYTILKIEFKPLDYQITFRLFGCCFSSVACLRKSSRSARSM
jgi:hypothetical protein